eukprot:5175195-Amphidinium_carterae.2
MFCIVNNCYKLAAKTLHDRFCLCLELCMQSEAAPSLPKEASDRASSRAECVKVVPPGQTALSTAVLTCHEDFA